jgi:hypothetical protein
LSPPYTHKKEDKSMKIQKKQAKKWIGKKIYAVRKDGVVVEGKLVKISGQKLLIQKPKGKKVHTKAIIPLVLYDLLAIGTSPYAYGGYGYGAYGAAPYGYGGYGAYGAAPYGYGYPAYDVW